MSRDHRRLRVFQRADAAVRSVYVLRFPTEERYGLQSQLRRAAVSVPTNIVEGAARKSEKEWLQFLYISMGSASEVRYLLELAQGLGFLSESDARAVTDEYDAIVRTLQSLIDSIEPDGGRRKAEGGGLS